MISKRGSDFYWKEGGKSAKRESSVEEPKEKSTPSAILLSSVVKFSKSCRLHLCS